MKMESLQQRREELERKEFQLKESLLKFDKFLKVGKLFGLIIHIYIYIYIYISTMFMKLSIQILDAQEL